MDPVSRGTPNAVTGASELTTPNVVVQGDGDGTISDSSIAVADVVQGAQELGTSGDVVIDDGDGTVSSSGVQLDDVVQGAQELGTSGDIVVDDGDGTVSSSGVQLSEVILGASDIGASGQIVQSDADGSISDSGIAVSELFATITTTAANVYTTLSASSAGDVICVTDVGTYTGSLAVNGRTLLAPGLTVTGYISVLGRATVVAKQCNQIIYDTTSSDCVARITLKSIVCTGFLAGTYGAISHVNSNANDAALIVDIESVSISATSSAYTSCVYLVPASSASSSISGRIGSVDIVETANVLTLGVLVRSTSASQSSIANLSIGRISISNATYPTNIAAVWVDDNGAGGTTAATVSSNIVSVGEGNELFHQLNGGVLSLSTLSADSTLGTGSNAGVVGVRVQQYDPTYTPTGDETTAETYYDPSEDTIVVPTASGSKISLGREMLTGVYNGTGSNLGEGYVVYVIGASGSMPSIAASDANMANSEYAVGMVTTSGGIDHGATGEVCIAGEVHMDTSAYTAGAPLYVPETPGLPVETAPLPPAHKVQICIAMNSDADPDVGKVLINKVVADQVPVDTLVYGFVSRSETACSFNDSTYVFTLADAGNGWSYYRAGRKYEISGDKTVTLPGSPPTAGVYYIYIDAIDGTLSQSTTPWSLDDDKVPVYIIVWNSTLTPKYKLMDERHSCSFTRTEHRYEHTTYGTRYQSGAALTGYTVGGTTDADNNFAVSEAKIWDEDYQHTLTALSDGGPYSVLYRTAASTWVWTDTPTVPYRHTVSGYIQYDNAGTMTEGQASRYYNTYMLLTTVEGISRFTMIHGQAEYSSLATAIAASFGNLTLTGFPFVEVSAAWHIVWETSNSYTTTGKCRLATAPIAIRVNLVQAGSTPGLGTMSVQNADNVAITGGTAVGLTSVSATTVSADNFNAQTSASSYDATQHTFKISSAATLTVASSAVTVASTAQLAVSATTASTSTSTGCATFGGGIGVAGGLSIDGAILGQETTGYMEIASGNASNSGANISMSGPSNADIAGYMRTGGTTQAKWDDDTTANFTRFHIYANTGTALYRIKTGANGTGPGGTGRALYIDNS